MQEHYMGNEDIFQSNQKYMFLNTWAKQSFEMKPQLQAFNLFTAYKKHVINTGALSIFISYTALVVFGH